mgnify:CR=1 FL=1
MRQYEHRCDVCEYSIRLMRAVENKDPYLSKKMILLNKVSKK